MKKIKFTCSHCQAKLRVPTHLAGVSAPCPKCGSTITAPSDISDAIEEEEVPRQAAVAEPRLQRQRIPAAVGGGAAVSASIPEPVPPAVSLSYTEPPQERREPVPQHGGGSYQSEPQTIQNFASPPASADPIFSGESQVVVEEILLHVDGPLPLDPITQPIQVSPRSDVLPEVRRESSDSPSLPRLDVSLAGEDLSTAAAALFPEGGSFQGKARVRLPQPGADPHQFNPDDFVVPAEIASEADEENAESLYANLGEFPDFDETRDDTVYSPLSLEGERLPIPLEDLALPSSDDEIFAPSPVVDAGAQAAEQDTYPEFLEDDFQNPPKEQAPLPDWLMTESVPVRLPESPASVSEGPFPEEHVAVPEEIGSRYEKPPLVAAFGNPEEAPLGLGISRGEFGEFDIDPLKEGSFGKLLSRSNEASATGGLPVAEESVRSESLSPFARPADSAIRSNDESVLDDFFGDPEDRDGGSKGLSKTAVVMISGGVGAAIIATVVVLFLINLMGGLDPTKDYRESVEESRQDPSKAASSIPSVPAEPSIDDVPAIIDPVAVSREGGIVNPNESEAEAPGTAGTRSAKAAPPIGSEEAPALSFDERVQQVVNDIGGNEGTRAEAAPSSLNPVDSAIASFTGASAPVTLAPIDLTAPPSPLEEAATSAAPAAPAAKSVNYNPAESFPAPGSGDSPLRYTNDVIDAFLRAPDWETRAKYAFNGGSLRPAIEDYHRKWPYERLQRFSLQLYQMEQSTALGGPFWVYLVSTSDADQGFPVLLRVEEGNLKVDWEIYAEFFDQHFLRFRKGTMPRPSSFRLVIERVSEYFGPDREAFTDVGDYFIYQMSPPYGDLDEFTEYAFVKKDSEVAKELDGSVGLNDEPLAVIVTVDEKAFAHGTKHFVITDYLTEGWFR